MTPILVFHDIVRSFDTRKRVLDGVTFSVGEEEIVALLGRNGTGKTTLMQIAMGMLFPESGRVELFGLSPTKFPVEVKRRVGYVGELPILPMRATIRELVKLHQRLFPSWDDQLERLLLERFGLDGNDDKLQKLSKGQVQQVALLCAVCHRPELLLLDEPASGLDPAARREFLETSIQLLNREGTSILFSSHHMSDVERLGGRVVLLDQGKVSLDHDLDGLREQHCVVVVDATEVPESAKISAIPGCLRTRYNAGAWHAVFRGAAAEVQLRVQFALPGVVVQAYSAPLEEMFVELVGGRRMDEAA